MASGYGGKREGFSNKGFTPPSPPPCPEDCPSNFSGSKTVENWGVFLFPHAKVMSRVFRKKIERIRKCNVHYIFRR
jgi:hypothetical protein